MVPKLIDKSRHAKYINLLSKVAADLIPISGGNARLAACVVHHNNIIAFGTNSNKTHPMQARYGKNDKSIFLHAEISAIKNALRYISIEELAECTLYVCRVKFQSSYRNSMQFGLAKPCPGCEHCIDSFGIQKVYHTTDTGYVRYK